MQRRFTLIELLVVIAIIAVLAGMLLAVVSKARHKSEQANCVNNLKQLTLGLDMYSQEYGERFPWYTQGATVGTPPTDGAGAYGGWVWYDEFPVPAERGPGIFNNFDVSKGTLYAYVHNTEVYRCPNDTTVSLCSYGANCNTRGVSRTAIKRPSETALLLEEGTLLAPTTNDGYFNTAMDLIVNRHNRGCVYSFCDGHVLWNAWNTEVAREHCSITEPAPP